MRTVRTADLVVVGWSESRGARGGLGAVHVARPADGDLVYTGSVGSGFTDAALAETLSMLTNLEIVACPCTGGAIPRGKEHPWVTLRLAAEVRYKELTGQGLLRQPSFGRFRDDKTAEQCEEEPLALPPGEEPEPLEIVETRDVAFTNLDKVFWSEDGYTKGDPIEYHRAVAPWMLTYLRDRPLVMTRYPDGIHGKSFFQKDAPPYAPEWVRAVTVWSEGSERELSCLVAEDVESLLYVINLGTIPHHVWSSRVVSLAAPDWCVLDLDPKEAPFTDVIEIALLIRDLCDEIGLPSFPKTSVSSGIHVLVPLGGRLTYEQSRTPGQLLGRVVVQERPDVATLTRSPERR